MDLFTRSLWGAATRERGEKRAEGRGLAGGDRGSLGVPPSRYPGFPAEQQGGSYRFSFHIALSFLHASTFQLKLPQIAKKPYLHAGDPVQRC